jgi:hypothetical protein
MIMTIGQPDIVNILYVTRNLRAADVRELEATRYGELDRDQLAWEIKTIWPINGNLWVLYAGDRPAALCGAAQPWPGMFSCYALATDQFGEIALPLTKFYKRYILPVISQHARRVEARSIDGHTEAHRWIRLLGAREEARLKDYGRNGEDFLVFTLALGDRERYEDNVDCRRGLEHV